MSHWESAIYTGKVFHQRFRPTQHKFDYTISLFWLKLSELTELDAGLSAFSVNKRNWLQFRRQDYLGTSEDLSQAVLTKMSELHGAPLSGDIFLLGQLRALGIYFSPVNFYFLRNTNGQYQFMLAEVSNTPWNERHYYLVDMVAQDDTQKAFHVSPFNPMEMTYKWRIKPPSESLSLIMDCHSSEKDFTAGINMKKMSLDNDNLRHTIRRIPSMSIKTMIGIYWQALKLFFKRTPIYDHPKNQEPR